MAIARRSAAPNEASVVLRQLVKRLGGRFSTEMGIDVDRGGRDVERWVLAATLFGTRISAAIVVRTYGVMVRAGVSTLSDVESRSWDDLVELLDRGGYVRYDFRTATRLQRLAASVRERYAGGIGSLSGSSMREVAEALDALPGWGPVTVSLFLREMRGVWPGVDPPMGERAVQAARHLGCITAAREPLARLKGMAEAARLDVRDVETALVRLWIAHHRGFERCAGGAGCTAIRVRFASTEPS